MGSDEISAPKPTPKAGSTVDAECFFYKEKGY